MILIGVILIHLVGLLAIYHILCGTIDDIGKGIAQALIEARKERANLYLENLESFGTRATDRIRRLR